MLCTFFFLFWSISNPSNLLLLFERLRALQVEKPEIWEAPAKIGGVVCREVNYGITAVCLCVGTMLTNNLQQSFPSCKLQVAECISIYLTIQCKNFSDTLHIQWVSAKLHQNNLSMHQCSKWKWQCVLQHLWLWLWYDNSPNPPTPIMFHNLSSEHPFFSKGN